MDESSIDSYYLQLVGIHEFTYFNSKEKQDSVYINSYGFSGTYDNGSSMFFYDKIKNRIKDYLGFDYYCEKVKYDKQLLKTSKTEGLYITNYVMYNSDLKLKK
jgi:hypothetical protein